ncbi:TonB-dependent siderophore receptor [Roseateles aquatilis]|uniref:TonB-dependent siderophore receptor n=1 Tax=Roseateles aquatilis TaxID=431061 RepID=A0A246J0T0_9BURK|nr:TonB-dependent siderophore receptor [Roseateles aquatilis]OWQ86176.1 TonB-dependent siderophore receptor [Roseateles aquatilis]
MSRNHLSVLPVAAAVALLLSGSVHAQASSAPGAAAARADAAVADAGDATDAADSGDAGKASAADRRRALDRVTISAARKKLEGASTRLPLTARETPQSVSSIDSERLENETLISINDVMQNITGVNVSFYDTQRPLYFARGFQITDFQVDGIPTYSGGTNQEYDTVFYSRIDVVRGANGLTTGAGIPSATVNMTRKRPEKTFQAYGGLIMGSWDHHRVEVDVNTPLTRDGRVRARFIAAAQERDFFRDRHSETKTAFMGTVEADLLPGTTVTLGYQDQNNVPKSPIWGTIPRFASDGSLANLPRSTSFSPSWTRWSRQSGTAYASLDHKLGEDWSLKVIANHSEGDSFSLRTYASGYANPTTGAGLKLLAAVGKSWERRDSLDVYASGTVSLFGRAHDLVIGANGVKTRTTTPTLSAISGWSYTIPDIRTWDGSAPAPTFSPTGAKRIATTEQSGVFATARWRVTEPLSVITGARVSNWKTGTDAYNTAGNFTATTGAYKVTDEVSPYVGFVYDLAESVSLYASYTDLFKPQNNKDKDNNLLAPIRGSNTEVGLKGDLFDKRLALSFAVFEAKQDNYAVRDSSQLEGSLPDGSSAYIGVNGTKTKGFEFDAAGQIAPGWTLNAGYANTRITRHPSDLIYANLPRHTLQLNTSYRMGGAWERLTVGGGLNWQSKVTGYGIAHPTLGTVTVDQGAYVLVNLHANYQLNDHFSLGVSVRNALDKTYWANLDYPNYGDPRSVMVSLRGRF